LAFCLRREAGPGEMGAAASLPEGAGSVLAKLRGPKEDNSLDLDAPEGEEENQEVNMNDPRLVKRAYRKSQQELQSAKETLATNNERVQSLTNKLSEMLGALKLLKNENAALARDLEKAEAELGKNADPEREAYMHKYAHDKLLEEFERYKVEIAEQQKKEAQEMRRMQENLANRAAADDAAKAALRAEIKDLRLALSRGATMGVHRSGSTEAGGADNTSVEGASKKGAAKKSGKHEVEVAEFNPSSGLQVHSPRPNPSCASPEQGGARRRCARPAACAEHAQQPPPPLSLPY
jgi:hypothetical protein